MKDISLILRAKSYIDDLANGISPIDGNPVPESDLINNVRVSRCFFFISDILQQVIDGSVPVKKKKTKKLPFELTDEQISAFGFSNTPISITHVANRFNELIDTEKMERLSYKQITGWLKSIGMLEDPNGKYGTAKTAPTENGRQIGITIEKRIGGTGEYYAIYYSREAQQFILDHIEVIADFSTRSE